VLVISGTHPRRRAVRVMVMAVMEVRQHVSTIKIRQPHDPVNRCRQSQAAFFEWERFEFLIVKLLQRGSTIIRFIHGF
jgi:hypothetical protein